MSRRIGVPASRRTLWRGEEEEGTARETRDRDNEAFLLTFSLWFVCFLFLSATYRCWFPDNRFVCLCFFFVARRSFLLFPCLSFALVQLLVVLFFSFCSIVIEPFPRKHRLGTLLCLCISFLLCHSFMFFNLLYDCSTRLFSRFSFLSWLICCLDAVVQADPQFHLLKFQLASASIRNLIGLNTRIQELVAARLDRLVYEDCELLKLSNFFADMVRAMQRMCGLWSTNSDFGTN